MKLKNLKIEMIPSYRDNAGKYEGEIEYEGVRGNVQMKLDAKLSEALLLCIGSTVTKFAAESARQLEESIALSVEEARKTPLIEA